MRPSCGTRFSEMSSFEITLMRDAILSLIASGGCAISDQACRRDGSGSGRISRRARSGCRTRRALIASSRIFWMILDDRRVVDTSGLASSSAGLTAVLATIDFEVFESATRVLRCSRPSPRRTWRSAGLSLSSSTTHRLDDEVGLEPDLVERLHDSPDRTPRRTAGCRACAAAARGASGAIFASTEIPCRSGRGRSRSRSSSGAPNARREQPRPASRSSACESSICSTKPMLGGLRLRSAAPRRRTPTISPCCTMRSREAADVAGCRVRCHESGCRVDRLSSIRRSAIPSRSTCLFQTHKS